MPFAAKILQLTRPLQIFLTVLAYVLGLSLARYLGQTLAPLPALGGAALLMLLLAAARLLEAFYRFPLEPYFPEETPTRRAEFQRTLWVTTLLLLGLAALIASLMLFGALLNPVAALFLLLALIISVALGVPPLRLIDRGFGEFSLALFMGVVAPSLAFSLQAADFHRLIPLITLPLFAMALAGLLAFDFPDYAADLKRGRRTMLIRLTWQHAIPVHNLLLAAAYLGFIVAIFLGLSLARIWPALLTLPLAAYQMFMLLRISDGAKPVWPALTTNAAAIFGITTYLLILSFWLS